jgi:DNA-binding MarR family transcriptional regulator
MAKTIRQPRSSGPEPALAAQVADEFGPLMAGERATFAHRCHERQISMAHLFLMTKIEGHGAMPMTRVAELIGSSLPAASGVVGRMEERGLVQRQHDVHDRRVVNVSLTRAGIEELSGLQAARRKRIIAALANLTTEEASQLLESIRILRAAFERLDEQGVTA